MQLINESNKCTKTAQCHHREKTDSISCTTEQVAAAADSSSETELKLCSVKVPAGVHTTSVKKQKSHAGDNVKISTDSTADNWLEIDSWYLEKLYPEQPYAEKCHGKSNPSAISQDRPRKAKHVAKSSINVHECCTKCFPETSENAQKLHQQKVQQNSVRDNDSFGLQESFLQEEADFNPMFPQLCITDTRSYDNTLDNTLEINIGNMATVALVDTGATISCMSEALLDKIQPKYVKYLTNDISHIYGVGSKQHDISHKVQLEISVEGHKFTQNFYVLKNQYSLILGMDFITKHKVKLDFENSLTQIGEHTFKLHPPPGRATLLRAAESTLISPNSAEIVNATLSKQPKFDTLLSEPVNALTRKYPGLISAEAVISSANPLCRLVNSTEAPISVPAGTVIAIARTISVNAITESEHFLDLEQNHMRLT